MAILSSLLKSVWTRHLYEARREEVCGVPDTWQQQPETSPTVWVAWPTENRSAASNRFMTHLAMVEADARGDAANSDDHVTDEDTRRRRSSRPEVPARAPSADSRKSDVIPPAAAIHRRRRLYPFRNIFSGTPSRTRTRAYGLGVRGVHVSSHLCVYMPPPAFTTHGISQARGTHANALEQWHHVASCASIVGANVGAATRIVGTAYEWNYRAASGIRESSL